MKIPSAYKRTPRTVILEGTEFPIESHRKFKLTKKESYLLLWDSIASDVAIGALQNDNIKGSSTTDRNLLA